MSVAISGLHGQTSEKQGTSHPSDVDLSLGTPAGNEGARERGSEGTREQGNEGTSHPSDEDLSLGTAAGNEGAREQGSRGARERGSKGAREQVATGFGLAIGDAERGARRAALRSLLYWCEQIRRRNGFGKRWTIFGLPGAMPTSHRPKRANAPVSLRRWLRGRAIMAASFAT